MRTAGAAGSGAGFAGPSRTLQGVLADVLLEEVVGLSSVVLWQQVCQCSVPAGAGSVEGRTKKEKNHSASLLATAGLPFLNYKTTATRSKFSTQHTAREIA